MAGSTTTTSFSEVTAGIEALAERWRSERQERQRRRELHPEDFAALADTGFLEVVVPEGEGGLWRGVEATARPVCELLRTLAGGDSSVALVAAMHPAVVIQWLASDDEDNPAWAEQRAAVTASVRDGHQWGTVTSEPGSGGDASRSSTAAVPGSPGSVPLPGEWYRLSGDKHFGSGLGMASFMVTTGQVDGEEAPATFVVDVRGFDQSAPGPIRVTAPWDGAGMTATQSHGVRLEEMPAVRSAWRRPSRHQMVNHGPLTMALFSSVVLGVLDEAVRSARAQVVRRRDDLRAFEQTEWARADMEHWLAVQAWEGVVAAIEAGNRPVSFGAALRGKTAIAELAEQVLNRIVRVIGGSAYSRRSPYSYWLEDVRALGYLRPPWPLAFDGLFEGSLR